MGQADKPRPLVTEEFQVPRRPLSIALGVVLAVVVVMGLNFAARGFLDRRTTNRTYWLISAKWRILEDQKEPIDWLILGDSSCNQGVRPDVLSRELGGRALNLCTIGDLLVVNDSWMLSRLIENGDVPKNVLLVHAFDTYPRSMKEKRKDMLARTPLPWGFWRRMKPPIDLTPDEQKDLFVGRHFSLYAENTTLTDWALHPSKPFEPGFTTDEFGYMRNDVVRPAATVRDGMKNKRKAAKHRGSSQVGVENKAAFAHIMRLSDRHRFRVFVTMGPTWDGLAKDEKYAKRLRRLKKELQQISKRRPRVKYFWFGPTDGFPATQMENADHVNHEAAEVYTVALAERIKTAFEPKSDKPDEAKSEPPDAGVTSGDDGDDDDGPDDGATDDGPDAPTGEPDPDGSGDDDDKE